VGHWAADKSHARNIEKPTRDPSSRHYPATPLPRIGEVGSPLPGPGDSFSEYAPEPDPVTKKRDVVWFALNDDRPLFAFAGIWYAVVEPIHPKAMPVILTTDEERDLWMRVAMGGGQGRCKDRCRMTRLRSWLGARTRKIKRLRD
jgi:hypothetical protein